MILRWLLEVALLVGALGYLARRIDRGVLVLVTLGSFALRLLVGEGLYLISARHLPLLSSSQLPNGLWSFASDAVQFDAAGKEIAARLAASEPQAIGGHGFNELIGGLYFVFGPTPPTMLAFNAACAAACVPLAWLLARQAQMPRSGSLAAALLLALWPSSFAWSGQVLKDPLEWLGTFACLAGGSLLITERLDKWSALAGLALFLGGGLSMVVLRGYALVVFGFGLAVVLVVFLVRHRSKLAKSAWLTAAGLALILTAGTVVNRGTLGTVVGSVLRDSFLQAASPVASSVGFHVQAPQPADQAAFTAAELAVWDARPDIRAYYRQQFPTLSPIEAMDVWLRRDDVHVNIERYAGELTGLDYVSGQFPPVQPHGIEVCPPLSRLIAVRLRFNANGGGSLLGQGELFRSCGDIVADIPHAFAMAFLFPLPSAWVAGGSVGAVRYFSALDAVVLWLLLPGLIAGAANGFRRSDGVNAAIVVGALLLGAGMGLAVTNFGTLFRLRLEIILPAIVLASDGWILLLRWLSHVRSGLTRGVVEYPSKGFQGR